MKNGQEKSCEVNRAYDPEPFFELEPGRPHGRICSGGCPPLQSVVYGRQSRFGASGSKRRRLTVYYSSPLFSVRCNDEPVAFTVLEHRVGSPGLFLRRGPRLPLRRVAIPGTAFIASIAYSAYLVQKFAIHGLAEFCRVHAVDTKSPLALIGVELCIYAAATILFFAVERPFLQLRRRVAPGNLRAH
jgi:hypothetical protein